MDPARLQREPTQGELTALRAVALHGTIRRAAAALCISMHTVDAHLDSIRSKTKLRYLPQIIWWAASQGWLKEPPDIRIFK